VPRIRPACVIGEVIVGEFNATLIESCASPDVSFARPKSSTLTVPSGRILMFAGFRSRWTMPIACAASSASRDLPRDRQDLVDRHRPSCEALAKVLSGNELHDDGARAVGGLDTVDVRDVWMVQRSKGLRLAIEPDQALGILDELVGKHFERDVAIEHGVSRAVHLAHSTRAEPFGDLVNAESGARRERHEWGSDSL